MYIGTEAREHMRWGNPLILKLRGEEVSEKQWSQRRRPALSLKFPVIHVEEFQFHSKIRRKSLKSVLLLLFKLFKLKTKKKCSPISSTPYLPPTSGNHNLFSVSVSLVFNFLLLYSIYKSIRENICSLSLSYLFNLA